MADGDQRRLGGTETSHAYNRPLTAARAALPGPSTRVAGLDETPGTSGTAGTSAVSPGIVSLALDAAALRREPEETQREPTTLAGTFELITDAFLMLDKRWRVSYANHVAFEMFARAGATTITTASLRRAFPTVLHSHVPKTLRRAVATGEPTEFELLLDPPGRWVEIRGYPTPEGMSLFARDVTERHVAEERARGLHEIGAVLTQTLTAEQVARVMMGRVPALAGAYSCNVALLTQDGRTLQYRYGHEGLLHIDPNEWLEVPIDSETPIAEAVRTRGPLFHGHRDQYLADRPGVAEVSLATRENAWAALPLIASGRVLGALAVTWTGEQAFREADRAFLLTLAGQCAQALERARLYEREHSVATELQRSLLPSRLPDVPNLQLAARYLPGSPGVDVGGDWYDVINLPGGMVGLVLGDVIGKGARAAAVMGRVQASLRAYAALSTEPATVATWLERLFTELGDVDALVTLVYAVLNPDTGKLRLTSAGHLPPLLALADGTTRYLDLQPAPPLGAAGNVEHPQLEHTLAPGDTLLLYSDGLVEDRQRPLDEGLRQLAETVTGRPTRDLAELCDHLLPAMLHDRRDDDVALLAVQIPAGVDAEAAGRSDPLAADEIEADEDLEITLPGERTLEAVLPADPRSLWEARRLIGAALRAWEMTELVDDAALCTHELVANALDHAQSEVHLRIRRRRRGVRVEVADRLPAMRPILIEPPWYATKGRGLLLVQSLSTNWGLQSGDDSKIVWFELDRAS